jgi:hypothetical protein
MIAFSCLPNAVVGLAPGTNVIIPFVSIVRSNCRVHVVKSSSGPEELVRIAGARPQEVKTKGIGKMILSQGLLKASMQVELAGTTADVHTASPTPTFYFYFDTSGAQPGAPGTDPFAGLSQMMGGDVFPPGAKTAADFSLIHLTLVDNARRADLGKVTGGKPKDTIDTVCSSWKALLKGGFRPERSRLCSRGDPSQYP